MILTIRPAVRSEAEWIGLHLRREDREEVERASGLHPEYVIPMAFDLARECYTIRLTDANGRIETDPAVIFGISPDPHHEGWGIMWLLGTDAIRRAALSILREAPKWLDHFNQLYPNGIHNIVDAANTLHIRWLLLTGFSLDSALDVRGNPFVHAVRCRGKEYIS